MTTERKEKLHRWNTGINSALLSLCTFFLLQIYLKIERMDTAMQDLTTKQSVQAQVISNHDKWLQDLIKAVFIGDKK